MNKLSIISVFAWCLVNVFQFSEQLPNFGLIGQLQQHKKKVDDAKNYLSRYGYLGGDFADNLSSEEGLEKKIRIFQRYAAVPETGKLDSPTIKRMKEPRCGMRDPISKMGFHRSKRWTLQGQKWDFSKDPTRTLKWKLVNSARNIPFETVRNVIRKALEKWSEVAEINFKESSSNKSDIIIKFARRRHGDGDPFDGRSGTLAHAFYPNPEKAKSGDIHFDDDEEFTVDEKYGIDLVWVATHEAGHSLGLEHSDVQDAVMYPWYQGDGGEFSLSNDDIIGIQTLYGARAKKEKTEAPPEAPTEAATEAPTKPMKKTKKYSKDCPKGVSASLIDPSTGWMFVFYGTNFYLVSRNGLKYGPLPTSSYFREVNSPVTAAYVRKSDQHLILFTGNRYYEYFNFQLQYGPLPVSDFGIPSTANVDAAFYWQRNNRLYIFTGTEYYRFNEKTSTVDQSYPRTISKKWRGLPSRITAALTSFKSRGKPGPTYLISNDKFYEFNDDTIRVHPGYPQHIKKWLLCNSDAADPFIYPGDIGQLERYSEPIDS